MKITKASVCPVCGDRLNISELSCPSCKAEFPVEENISEYDRLDAAQSDFLRTFLTCRGNMKDVQNKLDKNEIYLICIFAIYLHFCNKFNLYHCCYF